MARRKSNAGLLGRFEKLFEFVNTRFAYIVGLPLVSALATLVIAYFQFLSAYQDKVSAQYKDDFSGASAAFTEVSKDFGTAQTLQQLIYFNYKEVINSPLESIGNTLQANSAHDLYKSYSTVRTSLRQNIDLLSRQAEMQIDWASNIKRDPAAPRNINVDPASRVKLGNYNFDCDAESNMPHFGSIQPKPGQPAAPKATIDESKLKCDSDLVNNMKALEGKPYTYICAYKKDKDDPTKKIIDSTKPPLRIDWYSAMHNVWTMYYCFDGTNTAIEAAREWASGSHVDPKVRQKFLDNRDNVENSLNNQVLRLQAFMSLAMLRLDNIRVRYRPVGFWCHVPGVRELINGVAWVDDKVTGRADLGCSPIRMSSADP